MKKLFYLFIGLILFSFNLWAQIWPPEGLNMPGGFNGWTNPPTIPAFAGIQNPQGKLLLDTSLTTRRYQTLIYVAASGGDCQGGTYNWLFTSGPPGNYYQNKWANVIVMMNTLQSYTFQGGSDNTVTLSNNTYYTVNWLDVGYQNTKAIWMPTSATPVDLVSVYQNPAPDNVYPGNPVTVTVVTSANKSPEEIIYVRYTTDNWTTSNLLEVNFTGNVGTAIIPGQSGGTVVKYYAFSTTVSNPTTDFDMYTIRHNNNNKQNYSYSVLSPYYTISATAGPNGTISPIGNIQVAHGDSIEFIITPDPGYFIDDVLVDANSVGPVSSYKFVNVTANHTIHATFTQKVNVTFNVNMKSQIKIGRFRPDLGDVVTVRGTFNDWGNSTNNPDTLIDLDGDSIYAKTILLKVSQTIEYKYWKTLRGGLDYEIGIPNREFTIGTNDTTTPLVYFNDEIEPVMVTFNVNMKVQMQKGKFKPEEGDEILVRGSFNGWGTMDTLTDADNDSIYTKVIPISREQTIEYKYWKTYRDGVDWETFWGNRTFYVGVNDTTTPLVYFNNEYPDVNVTFQVNMKVKMIEGNFKPDEGDVVTVRGSFNDWGNSTNNPDTLIDLDGDSIYVKTIPIPGNQTIYYKFWKTERNGQSWESDPERSYLIELTDVILPIEYFDRDEIVDATSFAVFSGWNMVSVPVSAPDFRKTVLFPTAISGAFAFDNGYITKDTLANGIGYWLKFPTTQNIELIGTPLQNYPINVVAGWNMIGSIGSNVSVNNISQVPENNIRSFYYGYNNGYQVTDTIYPGKAYWIKVAEAGQLILSSSGIYSRAPIVKFNNELIFKDATGNYQKLYFGKADNILKKMSEMPPLPPEGVFDVRLASNNIYADQKENVIVISSANYPVEISWKAVDQLNAKLYIDGKEITMENSGSILISDPAVKIVLKMDAEKLIPTEFGLAQNYPNPFNPVTVIKYQLPMDEFVELKVYNLLGQEIKTLVNEIQEAGYYEISFDASRLPSGVYFYKLNSGNFTSVKKMILMR